MGALVCGTPKISKTHGTMWAIQHMQTMDASCQESFMTSPDNLMGSAQYACTFSATPHAKPQLLRLSQSSCASSADSSLHLSDLHMCSALRCTSYPVWQTMVRGSIPLMFCPHPDVSRRAIHDVSNLSVHNTIRTNKVTAQKAVFGII